MIIAQNIWVIGIVLVLVLFFLFRSINKFANEKFHENHFKVHHPDKTTQHTNDAKMYLFNAVMWLIVTFVLIVLIILKIIENLEGIIY